MLDLDKCQYLALQDHVNSIENSGNIIVCNTKENEDKNELYIIFPKEHISSDGFKWKEINENLCSGLYRELYIIANIWFHSEWVQTKTTECMYVLDSFTHELQTLNTE